MLNLECTKLVEVVSDQDVIESVAQVVRSQFNEDHSKLVITNLKDVSYGVVQSVFETELYTRNNGEVVYSENRYVFMISDLVNFHRIEMYRK